MERRFSFRNSHKNIFYILLGLSAIFFAYQNFILPERPSRNIDTKTVQMIDGKYTPTANHLPVTEFSRDGRLSLHWGGTAKGPRLYLTRPENVQDYLYSKKNPRMGANLVTAATPDFNVDLVSVQAPYVASRIGSDLSFGGRVMLCEKSLKNPVVCEGNQDCYHVTLVSRYSKQLNEKQMRVRIVSNDVLIKVAKPKTPQAYIASVQVDPKSLKVGPMHDYSIMAEPTIVGDGRLLITRLGNASLTLTDGKTVKDRIDIVYSVYDSKSEPCNPEKWATFLPISHAHYDSKNKMKDRYKFARYPMRDSLGNTVPNGEEFGGTYPWMDRHAANLFFTTNGYNTFYKFDKKNNRVDMPFEEKPGSPKKGASYFTLAGITNFEEFSAKRELVEVAGKTGGVAVSGFWTHGKVVLLDGLTNNSDFLFRISDRIVNDKFEVDRENGDYRIDVKRHLKLYQGSKYESVGGVRERGEDLVDYVARLTPNSTFMSSLENRLNYNKALMPVTPRDVVWHFGTSRHTEEIAFDDYNSLFMLINAEMTGALEYGTSSMRHLAGYQAGGEAPPVDGFPRAIRNGYPALVQNTGTAPDSFMTLPYYGKIDTRYSRIEPIAKGGIYGKGLWMEEKGSLQFQVPPQQSDAYLSIAKNKNWFVGAFFDGRSNIAVEEMADFITLGKVSIRLKKIRPGTHLFDRVLFFKNGKAMGRVIFPANLVPWDNIWAHIGISFQANQPPEVFFNGFSLGRAHGVDGNKDSALHGLVSLAAGDNIVLGDSQDSSAPGFKGWYDDFKVVARVPTYEEACNYARGTLVALSLKKSDDPTLYAQASHYPAATHETIAKVVYEQNPARKFACHTRYFFSSKPETVLYSEDHGHFKNLPVGSRSIREEMIGMKNVLVYGSPRPDFTKNQFCLSCHSAFSEFAEMSVLALAKFATQKMQEDVRRQPMQPDRFFRGVIPANYFGEGKPARMIASNETDIDQFIHPKYSYVDVRWTNLGAQYKYSLDMIDSSSGSAKKIYACLDPRLLKNLTNYRLQSCLSKGDYKFPISADVKIRICYTANNSWSEANKKCSDFIPLNMHNNGVLDIYLQK